MFGLMPRRRERGRTGQLMAREDFPFGPFDALFNRFFGGWPISPWEDGGRTINWGLDMEETDKEVIIRAEAPGFEAKDFDVHLNGDVLTIQAEHKEAKGKEGEPVKYVLSDSPNRALLQAFKGIFNVSRVQLVYKLNGDSRQLVSIRKAPTRATGAVTGVVVVTNDWYVLVKPKNGPLDGYAAMAPTEAYKPVLEKIRACQKGDVVTIRFYTDFERHRIQTIRKVGTEKK